MSSSSWHVDMPALVHLTAVAYAFMRSPESNDNYLLGAVILAAPWSAIAALACTRLPARIAPPVLAFALGGLGVACAAFAPWDPALYGVVLLGGTQTVYGVREGVAPLAVALALLFRAIGGPPTGSTDASTVTLAAVGAFAAGMLAQVTMPSFGLALGAYRQPVCTTACSLVAASLPALLAAGAAVAAFSAPVRADLRWAAVAVALLVGFLLCVVRACGALRPHFILALCALVHSVFAVAGHDGAMLIGDAVVQPLALYMATSVGRSVVESATATCVASGEGHKSSGGQWLRAAVLDTALAACVSVLGLVCICLGRATQGCLVPSLVVAVALADA